MRSAGPPTAWCRSSPGSRQRRVLMFAWMNRGRSRTVATGEAVYWSRSRSRLWHWGEESRARAEGPRPAPRLRRRRAAAPSFERVGGIAFTTQPVITASSWALYQWRLDRGRSGPEAPDRSPLMTSSPAASAALLRADGARAPRRRARKPPRGADPAGSPSRSSTAKGLDAILKKIGESHRDRARHRQGRGCAASGLRIADLWFHAGAARAEPRSQAVLAELDRRFGLSGLAEGRAYAGLTPPLQPRAHPAPHPAAPATERREDCPPWVSGSIWLADRAADRAGRVRRQSCATSAPTSAPPSKGFKDAMAENDNKPETPAQPANRRNRPAASSTVA